MTTGAVVLDRTAILGVLEELSSMLAGDGAALRLTGLDQRTGQVAVDLELEDADCEDCVLPPAQLREVVSARLRAVDGFAAVRIHDPREGAPVTALRTDDAGTITVLDPTAGATAGDPDPGPPAGALTGKRVGIRVDVLWKAFDQTVEEWTRELEEAGATVSLWRRAQGLKGAEGAARQADYDAFVRGVDVIVSGLGNCGSCTSWSVKDAVNGLANGLPSAVVVTEQFQVLGKTLAADEGRPNLHMLVLPAFLNTLQEDEVRTAARAAYPRLLELLGATTS